MKALKIVAIIVGAFAVLLAVAIALALTPSVQTWAVRKALAGQPGLTAEIGRVAAGLSAADISDLRVVKDGAVITAKRVTANYSAWDYISKKRINVDQVTVTDLVADVREARPAASTSGTSATQGKGAPAAGSKTTGASGRQSEPTPSSTSFNGILNQAQFPMDVRVAKLDANGRALLPNSQTVNFELHGTNIETGQQAKIDWKVEFADAKKAADLQGLRSSGTAKVHIAGDRRIDVVEIDATAVADGPKLPKDQLKLTATANQPTAGGDENYVVNAELNRDGRLERILHGTAQYEARSRELAGGWQLAIRSEQLAAMLAGFGLPEVAASGNGKFTFKPDTGAASASGDVQGNVSGLEKISPELKQIGSMQFKTSFDGGLAGNAARLEKFQLETSTREGRKLAEINLAQRVGFDLTTKRVTLANPQAELARVAIQSLPLAWAQPFVKAVAIDSGELSLVLAVEAEPDGSRIRARSIEPVALRGVTVRSGGKKLADQVTITVRPQLDYSATRIVADLNDLNVSMPAGDTLAGKLGAEVTELATKPRIAFTSQVQAKILAALKPYLPLDPGPLAANLSAEGRLQGDVLYLGKMSAVVNRDNGALLTAFELLQPVTANLTQTTATVSRPDATAARVKLGEVPLAWAEAFVPKSKFAGSVAGATLEVSFRSIDDVTLVTTEPVALRGVSATLDGKPMLQGLDLLTELTATKRGDAVTYELRKFELKQGNTPLVTLTSAGQAQLKGKVTLTAKGNLDADVAALMRQPAAAQFATLNRGRLTTAFDANVGDTIQAKATVAARNLVARQNNQVLGDLDLTLTATMKTDGSGTIVAPVTLANAQRKSDVAIDATFGTTADKKSFVFAGRIASNQLFVDDFQPLAALAPAGEKPTPAPTRPVTRDTQPFWAGAQGKVQVDLKRVVYGQNYVISAVRGTAVITPSKLSLDGLEGRFKENPFKVSGGVTFAANQPKPYALAASADVQNFDVGEFLRSANPSEKPALETKATISARLNGNGGTVADLAKNAFGKFELTGTKGVARYLARKGGASSLVNVASLGLAILGAAKGSDTASALAEIARLLNEVPFDSMKMQVERGADLSFKLTSMELISPMVRMTGTGGVASKSTADLQNAPMNITLQLGAKGELGYLLQRVRMLGQKTDEKGYQLMTRSFTLGGTPSKPDSSSLWSILGEAAAGAFLR